MGAAELPGPGKDSLAGFSTISKAEVVAKSTCRLNQPRLFGETLHDNFAAPSRTRSSFFLRPPMGVNLFVKQIPSVPALPDKIGPFPPCHCGTRGHFTGAARRGRLAMVSARLRTGAELDTAPPADKKFVEGSYGGRNTKRPVPGELRIPAATTPQQLIDLRR